MKTGWKEIVQGERKRAPQKKGWERDKGERRERLTESETAINTAEGSGWERGNSRPLSDERSPTNPFNDKHVSVSPIPGLCSIYACVCVSLRPYVHVSVLLLLCQTDWLLTLTVQMMIYTWTHQHLVHHFGNSRGKHSSWVLTDTSHRTLNTALEPDNKTLHPLCSLSLSPPSVLSSAAS